MENANNSSFDQEKDPVRAKLSRRQALKLLGIGAASAAVLAACGDTATPAPAAADTTTSAAAATTSGAATTTSASGAATTTSAAAAGTTQIASGTISAGDIKASGKVVMMTAKDNTGTVAKIVAAFNAKNTGVTIDYQELPPDSTQIHNKFATAFAAKDSSIDVIAVDIPWAPEFGSAGFLLPLDKYVSPSFRSNFFESTLVGTTYKNQVYAIPWYLDAGVLYYRKDVLDKAGVQPPTNFTELIAAAKKLQTADMYGYVWPGFKNEGLSAVWMEILWGFGGDYYDQATNKILVNTPEAAASLQFMVDNIYTDKVTPDKVLTFKGPDLNNVFTQGNAVFMRNWTFYGGVAEGAGSKVKGLWAVTPFLAAQGKTAHSCLGPWNLAINANSKNPDASWKVIEYFSSAEAQKMRATGAGTAPARKDVYNETDLASNPVFKVLPEVFQNAKPRPVTPVYQQMSADIIQEYVSRAISRQMSPQDAVKNMADKSTALLAKFKG